MSGTSSDDSGELGEPGAASSSDGPAASTMTPPPPTGEPIEVEPVELEPFEPRAPTPLKAQWVAAVLAAAILADVTLQRVPWNNVAASLLIAAVAAGLAWSGLIRSRAAMVMLVLATVIGVFLAWRTGLLLTAFNLLTAVGLLVTAAVFGRRGDIWNVGPARLIGGLASAVGSAAVTPFVGLDEVAARYRVWNETGNDSAQALFRGVVIAVPIVLLLGVLLASADVVFESFFTGFDLRLGPLAGHLILASIGGTAMAALLRLAARDDETQSSGPRWQLGHIEAAVLLGSITVLFAGFSYAQLLTIMGGADDALTRAGLDPKQFARQGFFQLLWVAAITLIVIMTVRVLVQKAERGQGLVKWLSLITVALTMVIVTVAVVRIFYYIGDSGLTARRLYAVVITCWIAITFVLLAVRLLGFKADKAWLTPAAALTAVVILIILNLANPQRRIAEDNLARNSPVLVYHVEHGQFVGDGRATLADNLDRLSPELADDVKRALCYQYSDPAGVERSNESGLLAMNIGRQRAEDAIDRLCS